MADPVRHSNVMASNVMRNAGGVSTIIRSNSGPSSLNLHPQRIVFKPQINKNIDNGGEGVKKRKTA